MARQQDSQDIPISDFIESEAAALSEVVIRVHGAHNQGALLEITIPALMTIQNIQWSAARCASILLATEPMKDLYLKGITGETSPLSSDDRDTREEFLMRGAYGRLRLLGITPDPNRATPSRILDLDHVPELAISYARPNASLDITITIISSGTALCMVLFTVGIVMTMMRRRSELSNRLINVVEQVIIRERNGIGVFPTAVRHKAAEGAIQLLTGLSEREGIIVKADFRAETGARASLSANLSD